MVAIFQASFKPYASYLWSKISYIDKKNFNNNTLNRRSSTMSIKLRVGFIALFLALSSMMLPGIAQAYCRGCVGTGVIYNSTTGHYVPVEGKPGMVYRSVDGKLIPVAYGYCHHRLHHHRLACYHCMPRVTCTVRPAHWEGFMDWKSDSNVCFYVR